MTEQNPDLNSRRLNDAEQRLESLINRSQRILQSTGMGQAQSDISFSSDTSINSTMSLRSSHQSNISTESYSSIDDEPLTEPDTDNTDSTDSERTLPENLFIMPADVVQVLDEVEPMDVSAHVTRTRSREDQANLPGHERTENAQTNATVDQADVIVLDDTIDETDLVYVQTTENPVVPIIDLCTQVGPEHSYSRVNRTPPSRRAAARTREVDERSRSRSPIIMTAIPREPARAPTIPELSSPVQQQHNDTLSQWGTCSICFESYLRRQPHSTICGHVFCKTCITSAINVAKKCPLCRKKLTLKNVHPLHLS